MNWAHRHARELSVAGAYLALLIVLAILSPTFFRGQFRGTWVEAAPVLIVAIGMTLVIVAREIDISIGSQFSICSITAALASKAGLSLPLVLATTLGSGALMGAVNGLLIAFLGLPSIVATLAMMVILRQGLNWIRQGASVGDLPATFQWFGLSQRGGEWVLLISALALLIVTALIIQYVAAGRAVFAVGSDREAARLAGVRPRRVLLCVFIVMGVLTAAAAMLNASRFAIVDPGVGVGLELQVIAAVVIGGTAISGGRGSLLGTLIGVMLLISISPALQFLHLHAQWERAVQGAIILIAVASDALVRKSGRA